MVYLEYKSQLKAYSKKQFDPFCRRERIIFLDQQKNGIQTTVGQLNFFRWAIENNIIQYVEQNLADIEKDMNQSIRNLYKKNKKNNGNGMNGNGNDNENGFIHSSQNSILQNPIIQNSILHSTKQNNNFVQSTTNYSTDNSLESEIENNKKRRKRKELSISATKTVNKHDIKIIVKFE